MKDYYLLNIIIITLKIKTKIDMHLICKSFIAATHDYHWHWLDGSIVDDSVISWCPHSTYEVAIGAYCAVYDSTSQCVTNYLCNTSLPAPCVTSKFSIETNKKDMELQSLSNRYQLIYSVRIAFKFLSN